MASPFLTSPNGRDAAGPRVGGACCAFAGFGFDLKVLGLPPTSLTAFLPSILYLSILVVNIRYSNNYHLQPRISVAEMNPSDQQMPSEPAPIAVPAPQSTTDQPVSAAKPGPLLRKAAIRPEINRLRSEAEFSQ